MARACAICGKKRNIGNQRRLLRGHRNVTAKRSFRPNLQKTTYQGQKVLACVRCIKSATKTAKTK